MVVSQDLGTAIRTGLKGRCPNCAEGTVFKGFLKFADHCEACGFSYAEEDVADGPAVFIIFLASFIIVPLALGHQLLFDAPIFVVLIVWVPILILFCLALLRPFRGLMFALQIRNKATEIRNDDWDMRS